MKRMLATALLLGVSAAQGQVKDRAVAVQETEAVVTVTKVDKKARSVTFRGPKGNIGTLSVPPEAQNLDQVKPGQQYRMKYVESVAVEIRKGGVPTAASEQQVKLAPKGAKPGGVIVRTQQLTGVLDDVDYAKRYVSVRGPKGTVVPFKVADDVPLESLKAGDSIAVTYTGALTIEMKPN